MAKKLRIKLIRSTIGRIPKHRRTVAALGLRKINHIVEKDDSPVIQGMVKSISYMLEVEEIG
jgi:large subunit ribosomal protein L30